GRGAAGAVGARQVGRPGALELDERGAKRLFHLGRAGGEELEREAEAPPQDVTDLGHWRQSVGGWCSAGERDGAVVKFRIDQHIPPPLTAVEPALLDRASTAATANRPKP